MLKYVVCHFSLYLYLSIYKYIHIYIYIHMYTYAWMWKHSATCTSLSAITFCGVASVVRFLFCVKRTAAWQGHVITCAHGALIYFREIRPWKLCEFHTDTGPILRCDEDCGKACLMLLPFYSPLFLAPILQQFSLSIQTTTSTTGKEFGEIHSKNLVVITSVFQTPLQPLTRASALSSTGCLMHAQCRSISNWWCSKCWRPWIAVTSAIWPGICVTCSDSAIIPYQVHSFTVSQCWGGPPWSTAASHLLSFPWLRVPSSWSGFLWEWFRTIENLDSDINMRVWIYLD